MLAIYCFVATRFRNIALQVDVSFTGVRLCDLQSLQDRGLLIADVGYSRNDEYQRDRRGWKM